MKERPIEPNCFETEREEQWHDVGYYDGYKDALDKACEWLNDNTDNYYESSCQADNCYYDSEQMIEDFCKAMEK